MRRFLVRFITPESFVQTESSAGFTITTSGFEFSVHTGVLTAAPSSRPNWFEAGSQMIAGDTMLHNFLHPTGLLKQFDSAHGYSTACYQHARCGGVRRTG